MPFGAVILAHVAAVAALPPCKTAMILRVSGVLVRPPWQLSPR
jgi:hypothetical protein